MPTAGAAVSASRTLIAAHRGFIEGTSLIEDTIPAYERAIAHGADLLETDVHATRDHVLVLNHDADVHGVPIASTDFADLPRHADGSRVNTLVEFAHLGAASGVRLLVEQKVPGFERQMLDTLNRIVPSGNYDTFSFSGQAVANVHQIGPAVSNGELFHAQNLAIGLTPDAGTIIAAAKLHGASFVGLETTLASPATTRSISEAGLRNYVWTADSSHDIRRLLEDPNVHVIITNQLDRATAERAAMSVPGAVSGSVASAG